MTTPYGNPAPPPPPADPGAPPPRGDGPSTALTAIVLVALGAGAIFWAGLTLGGATTGRNADERAAIEAFTRTYQDIADRFIGTPVPEEVLGGALEGMFDVLEDPYSGYMSPAEYDAALGAAIGEFEGIGAVMETTDEAGDRCDVIDASCRLRVVNVLEGAPAEAAGLLAGDTVTAVDGESLEGTTIDDSVWRIRGPRGSDVALTIDRGGDELEVPITRATVVADDVRSATFADGQVGYLSIDNFSGNVADDFEADLRAHLDAGRDKLIVDVRDDPGGFVDATVEISSQFIADGPVFWEEYADGTQVAVEVTGDGIATDPGLELVLLVNGGSASASEILGGALQDAGRARLIGEPTFGKGTVQEWSELPGENGGYRLSIAKWLTRDKTWIDGEGLTPDIPVELDGERYWPGTTDADPGLDPQLQTAIALLLGEPLPDAATTTVVEASLAPAASTSP
jgi:carboxyl-terminal processing protease